jgi:hypothetical protein
VILLQKFSGNNHHNNNVYVDFVNKNVDFEVKVEEKGITYFLSFFSGVLLASFIFFLPIYFLTLGVYFSYLSVYGATDFPLHINNIINSILIILLILNFLVLLIFSLKFLNKKWRSERFPLVNAFTAKVSNLHIFFKKKWKEVNPEAIVNNRFIIPQFNNVVLEYELEGDFSKYITNLDIVNKYTNNAFKFTAIFTFSKKPEKGSMRVYYI